MSVYPCERTPTFLYSKAVMLELWGSQLQLTTVKQQAFLLLNLQKILFFQKKTYISNQSQLVKIEGDHMFILIIKIFYLSYICCLLAFCVNSLLCVVYGVLHNEKYIKTATLTSPCIND